MRAGGSDVADILQSGHHLLQLINDVLDLAKVEAGRMELNLEAFELRHAVEEVCSVVAPLAAEKGVRLSGEVAPEVGTVVLDPLRFKQILYNLLSNGVKFTDQGGQVDLRVDRADDRSLVLTVKDTGVGIAPSDLPRLFREFEQLDVGPGRRFEGSGLGLSLTKRLVERHGGTVEVASELGRGTIFTVRLPALAPTAPRTPPSPAATDPARTVSDRPSTETA